MKKVLLRVRYLSCMMVVLSWFMPKAFGADVSVLFSQELPNFPGTEGQILTVEYAPGESSRSHRHNSNTFVYVLEGSVMMQVKGGELKTLKAGDTFYESPDDIHTVSKNASDNDSAKILVFFIKDKGKPSTVPAE